MRRVETLMAGAAGIEPTTPGFGVPVATEEHEPLKVPGLTYRAWPFALAFGSGITEAGVGT